MHNSRRSQATIFRRTESYELYADAYLTATVLDHTTSIQGHPLNHSRK